MKNVKISIITISYNSAKTIERTIKSVISQHYDNLEYIIIDGNSSDGTQKIIEKYKERISFYISEPDKGISDAFNKGISYATGELICMINSDDVMSAGAAQRVADSFENGIDVYYGDVISIDQYGNDIRRQPRRLSRFIFSQPLYHQSTYITRKAYEKYGTYDVALKMAMDYELLYKMYSDGAQFKYIPAVLSEFSLEGLSGSNELKNACAVYRVSIKGGTKKIFALYYLIRSYTTHYLKCLFKGKKMRQIAYKISDKL